MMKIVDRVVEQRETNMWTNTKRENMIEKNINKSESKQKKKRRKTIQTNRVGWRTTRIYCYGRHKKR